MTRRASSRVWAASFAGACAGLALAVAGVVLMSREGLAQPAPTVPVAGGAFPTLRLISQSQYLHTVAAVFGQDVAANVRFAPVKRTEGLLAVGAASATVTPGAMERLDAAARSVSDQVTDDRHRAFLVPCKPASAAARDDACARKFLSGVGRLLYRRPLTQDELELKVRTAGAAADNGEGFYSGLSYALTSLLVSPNFLLIRETLEPDPGRPGAWRLDGYSKAARLSFLLWDAAPDEDLLQAAAHGDLHESKGLRRQVERMLGAPQIEAGVRAFFEDFLLLETFDNLAKDSTIYPAFTSLVVKEAREQILRSAVDHMVTRRGDYRDLFTTRRTMISAGLASLYRVPVKLGPNEWAAYEFPPSDPRSGILTQVAFLAQYAHPGRSSPTRRGRAIREVLLCQKVPDPPPNVDFSVIEDPNAKFHTARERLTAHNTDPVCAGCHKITDPLGLALENFDGAGQYRASELGAPIDSSGVLDGVKYPDAAGLGQALHDSEALRACIIDRLYAYGVGRPVMEAEESELAQFETSLDKTGYRLDDLLRTIIYSPTFFAVRPAVDEAARKTASLH